MDAFQNLSGSQGRTSQSISSLKFAALIHREETRYDYNPLDVLSTQSKIARSSRNNLQANPQAYGLTQYNETPRATFLPGTSAFNPIFNNPAYYMPLQPGAASQFRSVPANLIYQSPSSNSAQWELAQRANHFQDPRQQLAGFSHPRNYYLGNPRTDSAEQDRSYDLAMPQHPFAITGLRPSYGRPLRDGNLDTEHRTEQLDMLNSGVGYERKDASYFQIGVVGDTLPTICNNELIIRRSSNETGLSLVALTMMQASQRQ